MTTDKEKLEEAKKSNYQKIGGKIVTVATRIIVVLCIIMFGSIPIAIITMLWRFILNV